MRELERHLDDSSETANAERLDGRMETELTGDELEEAAGGRLPCYPETSAIPPPEDYYEPFGPSI